MRNRILAVLVIVVLALTAAVVLASCSSSTTVHISASQSAVAKSDARALAKCLPTGPAAQIALARSLTTPAGRKALADKCGIPPQRKAAFEQQLLAAGENGHLTTHNGRVVFFTVTVPHLIELNQ